MERRPGAEREAVLKSDLAREEAMHSARPFWLGTSWKMNGSQSTAAHYAQVLARFDWKALEDFIPFIIPPFFLVERLAAALIPGTPVRVGVQNVHWAQEGAFTGEIAPGMAREVGATIAEIGHYERRKLFGETDETVCARVAGALSAGLTPLICIGDSRVERDAGAAVATIIRQAKIALSGIDRGDVARCLLAYEPTWSIGAEGTAAEPETISTTLQVLRQALTADYGDPGAVIPFLYGGSVNTANVSALAATPHVDGLFVGRAAWTPEGFIELLVKVRAARSGAR